MTWLKKLIIAVAIIVAAGVTLYPPWIYTAQETGISQVQKPAGYEFIFTPLDPEFDTYLAGVKLDVKRYLYQIFAITVLFTTAYREELLVR